MSEVNALAGKHRVCPKCKQDRGALEYAPSRGQFQPSGRSLYCMNCLERMVDAGNLEQVDKLMQWLDLPFVVDTWTRLYKSAKDKTLHLYVKTLDEAGVYNQLDWTKTNQIWKEAMEADSMSDHVDGANELWLMQMRRKWPSETPRSADDYRYLENLYEDVLATQNLVTATQRDDAKRLCEVGLIINQKLRAGLDAKKEMDEVIYVHVKLL